MLLRKTDVMAGILAGLIIGIPATFLGAKVWYSKPPGIDPRISPWPYIRNTGPEDPIIYYRTSFSQHGEDLAVESIFTNLGVRNPTYLDIGAHEPIAYSNTYLFYSQGYRGVLVEPNPSMAKKLQSTRPGDKVLNIGIGIEREEKVPFYIIGGRGGSSLSSFDKSVAESYTKKTNGAKYIAKVISIPLVNINRVIVENFSSKPNFISIDVEGLDLEIARSLDYDAYRPEVICIETVDYLSKTLKTDIIDFMKSKQYSVRGGSFVNTIFVADEALDSNNTKQ